MAGKKPRTNPFYALLVLFGIAFSLTACAYCVMAFRAVRGADVMANQARTPATQTPAGQSLLAFLDEHGARLLGVELALLAAATLGAIGTDGYWTRSPLAPAGAAPDEPPDP